MQRMTLGAPHISLNADGKFAVELDSSHGYEYVGWFDTFDSACDWAEGNAAFFWSFMEREGNDFVVSDPPCVSIPREGWSMRKSLNRRHPMPENFDNVVERDGERAWPSSASVAASASGYTPT
jgi:hypothetical protein